MRTTPSAQPPQQWTVADVAAHLKIKPATVRAYTHRGLLPAPDGHLGVTPWWWADTIKSLRRQGQGYRSDLRSVDPHTEGEDVHTPSPTTEHAQTLLDRCLHHVRSAVEALLQSDDPTTGELLAARRGLEVQSILQDCGARALDDEIVDAPAAELVTLARQDLDAMAEEDRPTRASSALAELTFMASDLDSLG